MAGVFGSKAPVAKVGTSDVNRVTSTGPTMTRREALWEIGRVLGSLVLADSLLALTSCGKKLPVEQKAAANKAVAVTPSFKSDEIEMSIGSASTDPKTGTVTVQTGLRLKDDGITGDGTGRICSIEVGPPKNYSGYSYASQVTKFDVFKKDGVIKESAETPVELTLPGFPLAISGKASEKVELGVKIIYWNSSDETRTVNGTLTLPGNFGQ